MARKFIDLEEAAGMLGVSPDTLREMRERQKVHGYRDGASWKFKPEDIERLIADREAAEQEGEFAEVDEDPDSILTSEVELGQSDDSTSSTIIGGKASLANPAESDIQIAVPKHDSDIDLDSSALALEPSSGSDVFSGSDILKTGSGVSPRFDELDALDLDLPSAADSGISSKILSDVVPASSLEGGSRAAGSDATKPEGSGLAFGSEDELSLGEASSAEVAASEDDEQLIDVETGGSAIDLAGDEDGDLVLGGSSHGDLSRTGDSGISLLDPSDSGLSLESAPLELGGSAVESLELGEDDMILTEDEAAGASGAAPGGAVGADSDDDFLLTPLEEASAEESDSGSQVIALDEDVEFEEAAPGASGVSTLEEAGGLLEDDLGEGLGAGALAPATVRETAPAAAGAGALAAAPEAPFSGWNIASLALCSVLLIFVGMFMFDLLRNMWSWNGPYSVNSSLMDMVLSWFEG
jgi:excisionase family DNA binding protein